MPTPIYILRATGSLAYFSGPTTKMDGKAYRTQASAEAQIPSFTDWCCDDGTNPFGAVSRGTIKVEVLTLNLED